MKRTIIAAAALLLFSIIGSSQNLSKYYLTFPSYGGTMYFIKPRVMDVSEGSMAEKKMKYDITCLAGHDSVFYTMSITSKESALNDTAIITRSDGTRQSLKVEKLYIDPKGSGWVSRVRIYMTYEDYKRLYDAGTPFKISIGSNQSMLAFGFPMHKWEKEKQLMKKIIDIIELNK